MKQINQYKRLLWHKYLRSNNKEMLPRYLHALAVLEKSEELVERFHFNIDHNRVQLAALFHDYAKFEKEERFKEVALKYEPELDLKKISPKIYHALLGPYIIKEELGIDDESILNAIRCHTTGSLNMDLLAEIIFLADFIDDSRIEDYFDEVKKLAKTNFKKAIALKFKQKIEELTNPSEELHILYNKYAEE